MLAQSGGSSQILPATAPVSSRTSASVMAFGPSSRDKSSASYRIAFAGCGAGLKRTVTDWWPVTWIAHPCHPPHAPSQESSTHPSSGLASSSAFDASSRYRLHRSLHALVVTAAPDRPPMRTDPFPAATATVRTVTLAGGPPSGFAADTRVLFPADSPHANRGAIAAKASAALGMVISPRPPPTPETQ